MEGPGETEHLMEIRRQVGDGEGSVREGGQELLGAPLLIVSSSPTAQGTSGASQQSPSWPGSFAMRWSPQVSAGPGLLGGYRLSGAMVAIGRLSHDPRDPWSLREGRKWIS